jgi:hypothetical protein
VESPVRRTDEPTSALSDPRRMTTPQTQTIGFLDAPDPTADAERMFDDDTAELGYVIAATQLWAYQPAAMAGLFDLARQITAGHTLTVRQRSILVTACASALDDSLLRTGMGLPVGRTQHPPTPRPRCCAA